MKELSRNLGNNWQLWWSLIVPHNGDCCSFGLHCIAVNLTSVLNVRQCPFLSAWMLSFYSLEDWSVFLIQIDSIHILWGPDIQKPPHTLTQEQDADCVTCGAHISLLWCLFVLVGVFICSFEAILNGFISHSMVLCALVASLLGRFMALMTFLQVKVGTLHA